MIPKPINKPMKPERGIKPFGMGLHVYTSVLNM